MKRSGWPVTTVIRFLLVALLLTAGAQTPQQLRAQAASRMQAEQDAAERHLAELNAQEAKAEEARHTPCSFEHPGTTMPGHDDSCVPITPSTITLPNGNTAQQLANGTVWATIRPAGEPINIQLSPRGPARGQFGTVIIKNLPEIVD